MTHGIFAYGSNMHLADLQRWIRERDLDAGAPSHIHPAWIPDYDLVWNYVSRARQGAAANVAPSPGARLYGVVLIGDDPLLEAIDLKEGHPVRYSRGHQPIRAHRLEDDTPMDAWLYTVTPDFIHPDPIYPRPDYLRLMIEGARQHRLPEDWIARLSSTPTQGG